MSHEIHSAIALVTAPVVEPLTLGETKDHLRVDSADDDALISALILSARAYAENVTWRALITRTFDLFMDRFPPQILVPMPPLVSVASVKYIDTAGAQQTLATTEYAVDIKSTPGRIRPAFGKAWPSIRFDMNAVEVRFTAGYGVSPGDVPERIRSAMLLHVGHLYERREDTLVGAPVARIPQGVDDLLFAYRVWHVS